MMALPGTIETFHHRISQFAQRNHSRWGMNLSLFLSSHTLSAQPHAIKQALPWSINIQIVGISKPTQQVPLSEPIPFSFGPLRDTHPFLLVPSPLFMH